MAPAFTAPVRRALYEPILLAGAPRGLAILNGTAAAALGLGLRAWLAGLTLFAAVHLAAVWAARWDPHVLEVVTRHLRLPARLEA
jgi:type IV secretion system protein VirB3